MADPYYGTSEEQAGLIQALLSGEQGLPTAQPNYAEPVVDYLNGWDLSMVSTAPLSVLSDPGAAYDPSMVFRFDIDKNKGTAPVVLGQGQTYVLTDASGEKVLGRASTPEGMRALMEGANAQKYGWNLYRGDEQGNYAAGSQLFGEADPRVGGVMGALIKYGLPIATSFIPGLNLLANPLTAGLGAGLGSVAGGLLTGENLGDSLKGGAITAATAGLLQGTGLDKVFGDALNSVPGVGDALRGVGNAFAPAASDVAANAAANAAANEIVVTAGRSAVPGLVGGLANAFVPSVVTNPITGEMSLAKPTQPSAEEPVGGFDLGDPNGIVVTGSRGVSPGLVTGGIGSLANLANITPAPMPPSSTTAPGDEIVVSARKEPVVPPSLVNSIIAGSAPSLLAPTTTQPAPTEPEKNNSLLNDIMKYYALGSGVLDMLGVGQGGAGGAGMGTPYTSQLGVLPTFTRGASTPFQGDYETYGQGPEWNFFGGAKPNG